MTDRWEWIDVEKERPPCDGLYHISNDINSTSAQGCHQYDGIGFISNGIYRTVKYWRHVIQACNGKKYGKYTVDWVNANFFAMGDFDKEQAMKAIEEWSE